LKEIDAKSLLKAGEKVALQMMQMNKGVIWPTVVVMEFDDKDDDIPMPQTDNKCWKKKEAHSREWVLKKWSSDFLAFDSPEFEIASFIRRKKGYYIVYIISETAMIAPPDDVDLPDHSFATGSQEYAEELKRRSKLPPVQLLSIMVLTMAGLHHRALELIGPKNSPQRRTGKVIFEATEAHPPEWIVEAVKYSYSKLGKGELLN